MTLSRDKKLMPDTSKQLARDEVVHCLTAAAHALEAASHVVMIGKDATSLFTDAKLLVDEVMTYGIDQLITTI